MANQLRTLVILGAGGDLTARLLLPGIGRLIAAGRGRDLELLGAGENEMTDQAWRELVANALAEGGAPSSVVTRTVSRSRYLRADATDPADLERVLSEARGAPAIYCALPPHVTELTCVALGKIVLPTGTTLALEKPFGTDLTSARTLNRTLASLLPESSIQRVDHFLGKSTVLNLLGVRFANRVMEAVWNAENIERVEICYDEALGLESRAGYYDRAGALIDMIQSHLLLVLALVAMEPPSSIDAEDLRGAMAQALRATRAWDGDPIGAGRRARYTAGTIGRRRFTAYSEEDGVDPARKTETLAEVRFAVDNWRWAGVPFVLRSGKAMGVASKSITIIFKAVPHLPTGLTGRQQPSALRIGLDPEAIELDLNINGAGSPFELDRVVLEAGFARGELDAYGEVIEGILDSDPTLSVRGDVAEECWRIVGPVLSAWRADKVPLETYRAGSNGPAKWRKRGPVTRRTHVDGAVTAD